MIVMLLRDRHRIFIRSFQFQFFVPLKVGEKKCCFHGLLLIAGRADVHAEPVSICNRQYLLHDGTTPGTAKLDVSACPSVKGLLTAEPVMLRNGFFQPHAMVLSYGILRAAGEQGCFDPAFRITVDDRVISCLLHALHLLSVKVEETTAAILHCLGITVKIHGGEAVCHSPHILCFIMGDRHRLSFLVLQQKLTLISVAGESVLILLAQFWLTAIEKEIS